MKLRIQFLLLFLLAFVFTALAQDTIPPSDGSAEWATQPAVYSGLFAALSSLLVYLSHFFPSLDGKMKGSVRIIVMGLIVAAITKGSWGDGWFTVLKNLITWGSQNATIGAVMYELVLRKLFGSSKDNPVAQLLKG